MTSPFLLPPSIFFNRPTICNWWKSCYHQRQLMQIAKLTIGGSHSPLASQQDASQENWFNLLNKNKVLSKSCYRGHTCGALACLLYISYCRRLSPSKYLFRPRVKDHKIFLTIANFFGKRGKQARKTIVSISTRARGTLQIRIWFIRQMFDHTLETNKHLLRPRVGDRTIRYS
jgi:hypothetical protein